MLLPPGCCREGVGLWTGVLLFPTPVASIQNKANSPFHQPWPLYCLLSGEQLDPTFGYTKSSYVFLKQVPYQMYDRQKWVGKCFFSPLSCFGSYCEELVLILLQTFGRSHQWRLLVLSFLLWEVFFFDYFLINSISLLTTGLFRFSIFFWVSFDSLRFSWNVSISSKLPNLLAYSCS